MIDWRRIAANRLWDVAAVLLAVVAVVRIGRMLPGRVLENDFAHYYVTSRMDWEGVSPFGANLATEYARYGLKFEEAVPTGTNPPSWLCLFGVIAQLPVRIAFWVWVGVEVLCLVMLLALIRHLFEGRLSLRGWRLLCCGVIASAPVYWHFYFGQLQLLLCALVLGAFAMLRKGRGMTAVLMVTGAALLKLYPAMLWPWFVWRAGRDGRERRRLLLASAVLGGAVVALTRPVWWWGVFAHGMPNLAADALGRSFNFNLPAFVATMLKFSAGANQAAVEAWWMIGAGVGLAYLAWAYWRCGRGNGERELEFGLMTVAMVLGMAKSSGTYLVWLVFPIALILVRTQQSPAAWRVASVTGMLMLLNCAGTIAGPWLDGHLWVKLPVNYLPLYGMLCVGAWLGFELRQKSGVTR